MNGGKKSMATATTQAPFSTALLTKPGQFMPSRYQQAIFDALEAGDKDLQVQAVAGSGKSTTIEQALKRLPANRISSALVCAFNNEIAKELGRRVPQTVTVKTIHSIGLSTIINAMKAEGASWSPSDKINGNKYRLMLNAYWQEKAGYNPEPELASAILSLVHFCRVTLTEFTAAVALDALIDEYEIETPAAYRQMIVNEIVPTLLRWGSQGRSKADEDGIVRDLSRPTWSPREMIDFDDMLWLPHVMNWAPKRFGLVLVDECQDLSSAQLELVLNSRAEGGQMLFVGDPRQAIYNFTGADVRSYAKIAERTGAQQLPLSVCYRCPRAVIAKAQGIVPEIEAGPDAAMGVVESIHQESFIGLVEPNDMVLCRVNAPLISTAFQLLADGKRARVKGRDIGAQMLKLLDNIGKRPGFQFARFYDHLADWQHGEMVALDPRKDNEMKIASINDRAESLRTLYGASVSRGARSMQDLRAEIQALFVDDGAGFITLSSIHRAKGLEANRVFILHPELMPHPMSKGERQIEQETNLMYVAYTRAKRELYTVITPRQ